MYTLYRHVLTADAARGLDFFIIMRVLEQSNYNNSCERHHIF